MPYGNYKNPQFFDESHLRLLSELIRDVEFRVTDFEEICDITERGDFVYLDPPYVPLNATSFVGYTSDKFPLTKHQSLFQKCVDMKNRGVKWIQSNSAVALVRDAFPESEGFEITEITARRAIHSRTPNATAQELIIQFK